MALQSSKTTCTIITLVSAEKSKKSKLTRKFAEKNCWYKEAIKGVRLPTQLHSLIVRGGKMYVVAGKMLTPEYSRDSYYMSEVHEFTFSKYITIYSSVSGLESKAVVKVRARGNLFMSSDLNPLHEAN